MEYICVGKISTTHGLKGELKIRSNFKYKKQVFIKDNILYIGQNKEERKIISYRPHQQYDMVIFDGLDDIDKVIKYKGLLVYCDKSIIKLDNEYLKEDLIGLNGIYNDKNIGIINDVIDQGNGNETIIINETIIPNNNNFVLKVDLENKKIYFKNIEGLIK